MTLISAAAAIAIAAPVSAVSADNQEGGTAAPACKPADVWPIAQTAWKRADGPKPKHRRRYERIKQCVGEPDRARAKWHNAKRKYEPLRKKKLAKRRAEAREANRYGDINPPGRAWLETTAECESGGDPTAVNPAGYYGKYQFSIPTWNSVGGRGNPAAAPEAEQDYRAAMLWRKAGPGQWPVCGQH